MFTGIVEEMGVVRSVEKSLAGMKLTILATSIMEDLPVGASVSVNGVCLTVASRTEREFSLELSPETLSVTSLGNLTVGTPVNLERAMRVAERLGGHLVAGHVDGVGTIRSRRPEGNATVITIEAPKDVLRYCVHKGSVTVDGVSMTINEVTEHALSVAVIPHTAKVTTLGLKIAGDPVNLETDLIGKYVERLLQERGHLPSKPSPVIDRDYLQKRGLL
jgi:riboflavin synthase